MSGGRDSKVGDKVTCRHKVHNLQIVHVLLSPINLFFLSFRLLSPHFFHPSPCSFCYSVSFFLTLLSPVTLFFLSSRLLLPHTLFPHHPVLSAIPSPFPSHFVHQSICSFCHSVSFSLTLCSPVNLFFHSVSFCSYFIHLFKKSARNRKVSGTF